MTDDMSETAADARAMSGHYQAAHRRLMGYMSLSATLTEAYDDGGRESVYRLHVMDLASRRMVPHHLATVERDCEHIGCDAVLMNSYLAGYLVETGQAGEHASATANRLLDEQRISVIRY